MTSNCAGALISLLRAEEEEPGFLESPAVAVVVIDHAVTEQPGTQIGPYKLLEQIGEGGMGVVYMADQQAPVRRRVALKIIKPGMDTRQVVARFEAERQALALMDHPNIARVLDAGATDSGRPYVVMELVRGVPITEFCDEGNLPLTERLDLFVQVCRAVQHAHQKGIIHRDLKPSNVLVTLHDGRPVPKVIDFGVAKATNQQLTEKTLFTNFTQMIGTPLYMSPEQAEMSGLDVDTRSDIYSLGVLLYELLTGATPFDKQRIHEASADEIRRIIRDEEPTKPSALIDALGQTRTNVAARRQLHPDRFAQLLRGDLDWIIMKSLEKDRVRRYQSAGGLARDIERYLAHEPIEARPPSASYRFQKFARRHRGAIATAAAVSLALVIGTLLSVWQAVRATHAERLAQARLATEIAVRGEAESARAAEAQQRTIAEQQRNEAESQRARAEASFQAARRVIDERFNAVADDELLSMPALQPLRTERLESTLRYYRQFIDLYRDDPTVKAQLAEAYRRIGEISRATGDDPQAFDAFQEAIRRYEQLMPDQTNEVKHRWGLASALYELGLVQKRARAAGIRGSLIQTRLELLAELDREEPGNPDYQLAVARAWTDLGAVQNALSRSVDAESALQRAVDCYGKLAGEQRDLAATGIFRSDVARAHYQLGVAQRAAGRLADAEASYGRACEAYERLIDDAPAAPSYRGNLARTYHDLATLYRLTGRPIDAEASHNRALELYERVVTDNPTVAEYRMGLGWAHYRLGCHQLVMGDRGRAEQNWKFAAEQFTAATDLGFNVAGAYKALGDSQAMLGQWAAAAAAYARVAEAYHFAEIPTLQWALLQLAAGDEAGYRATCSQLVDEYGASAGGRMALSIVMTCVAGETPADRTSQVLAIAERVAAGDPRNPVSQVFAAAAQFRAGQVREAIARLEAALPKLALAELAAPTKLDFVRLSRLAGETILTLSYARLGDHEALAKQRGALARRSMPSAPARRNTAMAPTNGRCRWRSIFRSASSNVSSRQPIRLKSNSKSKEPHSPNQHERKCRLRRES